MNPKVTRKVYPEEFKREAVRLATERGNISQVAHDLGIADNLLFRWKKRLETVPPKERAFPGCRCATVDKEAPATKRG